MTHDRHLLGDCCSLDGDACPTRCQNFAHAVVLVQAADTLKSPMPKETAMKLMNRPNPGETGNIHGMLVLHIGMRVRLLDALDVEKGVGEGC